MSVCQSVFCLPSSLPTMPLSNMHFCQSVRLRVRLPVQTLCLFVCWTVCHSNGMSVCPFSVFLPACLSHNPATLSVCAFSVLVPASYPAYPKYHLSVCLFSVFLQACLPSIPPFCPFFCLSICLLSVFLPASLPVQSPSICQSVCMTQSYNKSYIQPDRKMGIETGRVCRLVHRQICRKAGFRTGRTGWKAD